jgi:hypothetical protein
MPPPPKPHGRNQSPPVAQIAKEPILSDRHIVHRLYLWGNLVRRFLRLEAGVAHGAPSQDNEQRHQSAQGD